MKKTILTPLVASALVLAAATSAFAANRTFTGGVSNLWSDAGNWNGGIPASTDAPRLDKGFDVVLSYSAGTIGAIYLGGSTAVTNSLTIQNGGSLSASSIYISTGSAPQVGTLTLQNGATLSSGAIYVTTGSGKTGALVLQNGAYLTSGTIYVTTGSGQTGTLTISTGSYLTASSNGISLAADTGATNSVARAHIDGNAFFQGALSIGCATANPAGSSAAMTFSGSEFTVTSSTNTFRIGQNGTAVLKLGATDFGTIYYSAVSFSAGAQMVVDGSDFTGELNLALLIYRNAPSDVSGLTITFTNFDESYGELTVQDNLSWINPVGTPGDANYQEGYLLLHTAIPEPALAGVLLAATAVAFAVRRRRQS